MWRERWAVAEKTHTRGVGPGASYERLALSELAEPPASVAGSSHFASAARQAGWEQESMHRAAMGGIHSSNGECALRGAGAVRLA